MKKTLPFFVLLLGVLLPLTLTARDYEEELTGAQIWDEIFVDELHRKFLNEITLTQKFEDLLRQEGGKVVLDHGATRTPEKKVFEFILRLGKAFGLEMNGRYDFPEKKIIAVDLQSPGRNSFKWFSSYLEVDKFSARAARAVREDVARTNNQLSQQGMVMLKQLEQKGFLNRVEAEYLVNEIIYRFFSRQGPPVKLSTLDLLELESPETVNALLLGPDFNHIAYSLNDLEIKDWYGVEVIDALAAVLKEEGFSLIPSIQGKVGGVLRQTSTLAEEKGFEAVNEKGEVVTITRPSKFLEFIQRGAVVDEVGEVALEHKKIKLFRGFLRDNASKIYESTDIRVPSAEPETLVNVN